MKFNCSHQLWEDFDNFELKIFLEPYSYEHLIAALKDVYQKYLPVVQKWALESSVVLESAVFGVNKKGEIKCQSCKDQESVAA